MVATALHAFQKANPLAQQALAYAAVGLIVFVASLFGILTRPMGFLAAIWPANAILLGLMIRNPALSTSWGWLGAVLGYLAADIITGGDLPVIVWLTAANLAGVVTGFLLFQQLNENDRRLGRPLSVLYLFVICCAASAVAALTGGGAATIIFDRPFFSGLEFWFVTELVNSLVILPVILSMPASPDPLARIVERFRHPRSGWLPLIALLLSAGAAVGVAGPGSIAFPVPALLWCALSYRMFPVSLATMGVCGILLIALTSDLMHPGLTHDLLASTSSLRLGIALIALGPLTAASINQARAELLEQLQHIASHDALTGALNRRAFLDRTARLSGDLVAGTRPLTVFMLDIDHFKAVNDRHGHTVGDRVLAAFVSKVACTLRPDDIFARLGGEEFAIVLPGASRSDAEAIGERIRKAAKQCGAREEPLPRPSVSIGVALSPDFPGAGLERLLSLADEALYSAKAAGRDRLVIAEVSSCQSL